MKVLWFANTPCLASEKLAPKQNVGGWLKSLEEKLVEFTNIELSICFYWNVPLTPFKYRRTNYFPIYRNTGDTKIKRHFLKYFPQTNDTNEIKLLLNIIDIVKPDIIHIHGTEDNFGLVQEYTKIPCIISIQGLLSACAEKFYDGIPKSIVHKYESTGMKLKYTPLSIVYRDLKKRSLREQKILMFSKNILGRTNWDRRITRFLAPESRYYIGNEMLRSIFYEKRWKKGDFTVPINIVTVMSGTLYKGLETIVQTARLLIHNKAKCFRWTVIGIDENTPISIIVKNWLQINYLDLNIELVGSKNENQISQYLVDADIYCQCSHIENSSNSLCEAMLIGIPIVASFAGGTDSILENQKDGILAQAGDYYSFAGAIKSLVNDSGKAISCSDNARKKALIRHSATNIINALLKTYKSVIENEEKF